MPGGRPAAEIDITSNLARALLAEQHPDLTDLPIQPLDSGWDNEMFRLGDTLTLRLPRREIAADLIVNEQTWLPRLQGTLPLAIPAPVRLGRPAAGYPWRWSVLPWFEGAGADRQPPAGNEARTWAKFLNCLHVPAPHNAPANPVRGVPLADREKAVEERLGRLRSKTDFITPAIERLWHHGLAAPPGHPEAHRWLHGDLHAQNVLVEGDRFSAVIDWGDITAGDVATDLASIWSIFAERQAREEILSRYAPDQALLDRGKGWAVMFAVMPVDSGLINNPRHAVMGRAMLARLEADT